MLTKLNDTDFQALEAEWSKQCEEFGDDYSDYATPSIEFARKCSAENLARYGIFALPSLNGIVHINCARLPRTDGVTLRVLWLLLAPKYDYRDVSAQDLAVLSMNLVVGAYLLAKEGDFQAQHVKIHLANAVDRSYFTSIAVALGSQQLFKDVEIRGQWLHFSL